MKVTWMHIARSGRCIAFAIALPVSPSIWALCAVGPTCFQSAWTAQGENPLECLAIVAAVAPFAAMFGPIAHDEEEPPSMLPEVLLTAFLLAILITILSALIRSRLSGNR
jgi:hypothetical protein